MEVFNELVVKLHDAHDEYLNFSSDIDQISIIVRQWFEAHESDIFSFKQILCEYMSKAKCVVHEMKSIASMGCRSPLQNSRNPKSVG